MGDVGVCIFGYSPYVGSEFVAHSLLPVVFPLPQAGLGISTLLMYVPTPLAATHQSGSLALLSVALWLMNELRRLPR